MIYLQGEGEHTSWEPESATVRGLIEARLAARPLEEDHEEYFDYESLLKSPDDYTITVTAGQELEVVAHNLGLDEEFTTPLNRGTVLLTERAIDTDGVKLLVEQYGAEAAREVLVKKVKALVREADPEGGGGEGE
jgi:hypothetical protein